MPSTPKSFLIQIIVTGDPTPIVRSYYDNTPITGVLEVNVGDHVGWLVQVALASGRKTPAYALKFSDPTFFGVSSLVVTAGGTSQFLQVLAIRDRVSYSLDVTGIGCVFDPDIQSGSDTSTHRSASTAPRFVVTWDIGSNQITYTQNGAPGSGPIPAVLESPITFEVTGGTGTGFLIAFAANTNAWASPFDPEVATFQADASNPLEVSRVVADNAEGGDPANPAKFLFRGSILTTSGTLTSPHYEIDL